MARGKGKEEEQEEGGGAERGERGMGWVGGVEIGRAHV